METLFCEKFLKRTAKVQGVQRTLLTYLSLHSPFHPQPHSQHDSEKLGCSLPAPGKIGGCRDAGGVCPENPQAGKCCIMVVGGSRIGRAHPAVRQGEAAASDRGTLTGALPPSVLIWDKIAAI